MTRVLALCAAAALLAGCATPAKFQAKMDGFLGQSETVLIGTYGAPQSVYPLADGSKAVTYTRGGTMMLPGATSYQTVTSNTTGNVTMNQGVRQASGTYNAYTTTSVPVQGPAIPIALSCSVTFTIDPQGTIVRWSAQGNHCVAQ